MGLGSLEYEFGSENKFYYGQISLGKFQYGRKLSPSKQDGEAFYGRPFHVL